MADTPSWATLPTELKHAILSCVETEPSPSAVRVGCASVCKEWQSWFEHTNFAHLYINTNRISDFVSFVHNNPRRRSAVQKISICIQLKNPVSSLRREFHQIARNRQCLLHRVLCSLLNLLKAWTRPPHSPGLTLDILTVYSESRVTTFGTQPDRGLLHPGLNFYHRLPQIPIVTALILRGQYYQCLKYYNLAKLLRQNFTHLQTLHMERLTGESRVFGEDPGEDITSVVAAFPPTLKKWIFFDRANSTPISRPGANHLPFEKISAHLEHITWGYALDADNFFRSSIPPSDPEGHLSWSNLKTLSLTSQDFHHTQGIKKILIMAARAVQYMPRLEQLDIWHVDATHNPVSKGCMFTYTVDGGEGEAVSSWSSSYGEFRDVWGEVESSWLRAAEARGMRRLRSSCHGCEVVSMQAKQFPMKRKECAVAHLVGLDMDVLGDQVKVLEL